MHIGGLGQIHCWNGYSTEWRFEWLSLPHNIWVGSCLVLREVLCSCSNLHKLSVV